MKPVGIDVIELPPTELSFEITWVMIAPRLGVAA
jgi:hypothetical protein